MVAYMDEAVGSGNMCRCSSIGREYMSISCLSVNTTSAQDPGSTLGQSAKLMKSDDEIPFHSTTCARTSTLPTLLPHSTLATRSLQKPAKHRAHFAPTMRSRHRTLSSGAFGDALKLSATVRWALSAAFKGGSEGILGKVYSS